MSHLEVLVGDQSGSAEVTNCIDVSAAKRHNISMTNSPIALIFNTGVKYQKLQTIVD